MPRRPATAAPLDRYAAKRNFALTPEPPAEPAPAAEALSFVVQKHWATRLHYDFRLELDGVLLSWAVPKGPCFDPQEKRMAVHVEDHPVSYGGFEGTIPPRQYGAGTVIVWDRGRWEPVGDAHEGMQSGKLVFRLHGEKLAGLWELVRIAKPGDKQDPWMLFKKKDGWARPLAEYDVVAALPDSVIARPLGLLEEREGRPVAAAGAAAPEPTSPDQVAGALKARQPAELAPQLASLAEELPARGDWIYEIKLDGYRLLTRISKGRVTFFTRQGNDWTDKLTSLAREVQGLGLASAWLDGEIVVQGDDGMPSFNLLQTAFDARSAGRIVYFLFDLPYLEGFDLRPAALKDRRALLRRLVAAQASERLRFSADFVADPAALLATARALKLEGLLAKRADAPYVSQRSNTWLKLKCRLRQEFVIGGFAERAGASTEVGSLFLGLYDEAGVLRYAGNVGTGWNAATAADLRRRLAPLQTSTDPFDGAALEPGRWSKRVAGSERWVRPELVAEVAFAHWTPDGHARQATYLGLRADKPPRSVRRETAALAPPAAKPAAARSRVGAVKVTNPQRVIDPSSGLSKLDLVRYYESIAERMLPHLKARPTSLVRGPDGVGGSLFFQKHDATIAGLKQLDPALWPGHAPMIEVPSADALVAAAQMNVIEFHTWNSTTRRIDKPDRIVFDIDPGEGVKWPRVQEAALLTRTLLEELGLASWLKTSGGKGLHVVVPIEPRLAFDAVKDFSHAVVEHLAKTLPSRFVAKSGAANRIGKIFVDYLRNNRGATTAAAFSARARPGLGVSVPVSWEQLPALKGGAQWSIANARDHLSFETQDPWQDYWTCRQTLAAPIKALAGS